jgi:hypothetical protein
MALTAAQKVTLKADILANSDANTIYQNGDTSGLAALYNAPASPSHTVWKTGVSITHVGDTIVASELAGLTGVNIDRLSCIAQLSPMGVNPSKADRRAAFDDIFSGAGGVNTRAALAILWKRLATRAEKLFATGTGSDASPATLTFEGNISPSELVGL